MIRKQLNIRLDEEIHTKAKVIAILKGLTLNDYIEQSILRSLEKDNLLASNIKNFTKPGKNSQKENSK